MVDCESSLSVKCYLCGASHTTRKRDSVGADRGIDRTGQEAGSMTDRSKSGEEMF